MDAAEQPVEQEAQAATVVSAADKALLDMDMKDDNDMSDADSEFEFDVDDDD